MKIAFVGSRDFKDLEFAKLKMLQIMSENASAIMVSGGARGIDKLAEYCANSRGLKTEIYPAQWEQYGKKAGFIRNEFIIGASDLVFAFWDGSRKGTKHSIHLAIKMKKPLDIYVR